MEKLFGGSPGAVIVKLAIASLIIGVILSILGFDPEHLYDALVRLWNWISSLSIDTVKRLLRYVALGAIIVVPLWLVSRLFSLFGSGRREKLD
jgi:hypothetical protein